MTALHLLEFIVIMIVLVILHEMGHMVVAKRCGMRVERFSVFFGRPVWSFRRGETEYALGWLPLGGYVKITGMSREELVDREFDTQGNLLRETPVAPEIAARAYCNSTTPRKVATILAGPLANVLVALVLFAVSFWVGTPRYEITTTLASVGAQTPAAQAGVRPGDEIVAVNGVAAVIDPADGSTDLEAMRNEIRANPGEPVRLTVVRDGTTTTLTTPPLSSDPSDSSVGRLGVVFDQARVGTERLGPLDGVTSAVRFTAFLTKEQVLALGRIFTDKEVRDQVQSAIGIGATYDEFADEGLGTVLRFAGIISLILAIMNLLPLLPLDGGHIVFAIAERIRGRHMSLATYQRASIVGLALVMILVVLAINNDIARLTGSGFTP